MTQKFIISDHPWEILAEELEARNWSVQHFSQLSDLPENVINSLIDGETDITPELAMIIGSTLWTSVQLRLKLQNDYDVFLESQNITTMQKILKIEKRMGMYA